MSKKDIEEENKKEEKQTKEKEVIEEKKTHKILNTFIFIFIICVGIVLYSKYVGTEGLIVKEYRVESNILTSNFSGIKIIHFSDLLYKSTIDKSDVNDLVERINLFKPDIVVFTGNLVSYNVKLKDKDIEYLKSELSKINASIGLYAVYGENDYNTPSYEDIMTSSGFKILNNSYEELFYKTDESIYIVGFPSSLKENIELEKSFEFYDDMNRRYTIVLLSEGASIKYIDESTYEVDMILGGYSLNGSVVLPLYGGLFKDKNSYKYSEPYYKKGITDIFISSGLGTKNYEFRLFNKPSINLYRLKAQS